MIFIDVHVSKQYDIKPHLRLLSGTLTVATTIARSLGPKKTHFGRNYRFAGRNPTGTGSKSVCTCAGMSVSVYVKRQREEQREKGERKGGGMREANKLKTLKHLFP